MEVALILFAGALLAGLGFAGGWYLRGGQAPILIERPKRGKSPQWNPADQLQPVTPRDHKEAMKVQRPRG